MGAEYKNANGSSSFVLRFNTFSVLNDSFNKTSWMKHYCIRVALDRINLVLQNPATDVCVINFDIFNAVLTYSVDVQALFIC